VTENVEPLPSSLCTMISPPSAWARRCEMVSPSPVPPKLRVVLWSACENDSKIEPSLSCAIPMPVSDTAMRTD